MTHFGVLVALMVGIFSLLTGIFGVVWRASAGWAKLKSSVDNIEVRLIQVIVDKDKTHDHLDQRITFLERKTK
jgi:hypothetical protein